MSSLLDLYVFLVLSTMKLDPRRLSSPGCSWRPENGEFLHLVRALVRCYHHVTSGTDGHMASFQAGPKQFWSKDGLPQKDQNWHLGTNCLQLELLALQQDQWPGMSLEVLSIPPGH